MAATFKRSTSTTAAAAPVQAAAARPAGTFEKAVSFLNLSLPKKSGGAVKLGAIPLKLSSESESLLHEYLAASENPEDLQRRLDNIKSKLVLTWNQTSAGTGEKLELDL